MIALLAENVIPYILWYDRPADDWETQALPIGNSYMGAMIFGYVGRDHVYYNEKTFWSGGPGSVDNYNFGNRDGAADSLKQIRKILDRGEEPSGNLYGHVCGIVDGYGSYQNFGNVIIESDDTDYTNYRRELDISRSVATVEYDAGGVHYKREYFASFPQNVIVMRYSSNVSGAISINVSTEGVHGDSSDEAPTSYASTNGYDIQLRGHMTKGHVIGGDGNVGNGMTYESRLRVRPEGGYLSMSSYTVHVKNADAVTIFLTAGTEYKNEYPHYRGEDPHDANEHRLNVVKDMSYADLYAEHLRDYQGLFNRSEVFLGQEMNTEIPTDRILREYKDTPNIALENLLYNYGRYLLISSSRGDTLPANLQGVWCGSNTPNWQSDYHFNINLQMNYWPSQVTNLEETIKPLRDYVRSLEKPGRETARIHCGVDKGWVVTTMNNPFGFTAVGWAFDWGWAPTANAWITQNIWESYLFSQDKKVLEEEIYPIMKGVADFWTNALVNYTHSDGVTYLVSSPSYSPEQGPRTVATTFDQYLIRQFFSDYIEAVDALQKEEDYELRDRIKWQKDMLLPTPISKNGTIQEWKDDIYYGDIHHRHCSHLVGLYPGKEINKDTPELFEAAKKSLVERGDEATGWSMANKLNLWARALDGDHAHTLLSNLLKNGIYSNLFDTHPPFYIDGNFGATSGVAELLIQSHMGYIHVLPALPQVWPKGHYSGLKARGNFTVHAEWEDLKLNALSILSGSGKDCSVEYPGIEKARLFEDNVQISFTIVYADRIAFPTKAGKSYSFAFE